MATIEPSVVNSPKETMTSKGGYLRLTITSISDSDATTNKRYISCKLTIEGTRWVGLYKWESTLGGQTVSTETRTVEDWYPGHVLGTKNLTFDNDGAGNLSLTAYIKHIFYKGSSSWNTSYAKSITTTLVCSQLPRYANFTSHSATSTLNTITVSYAADANYTGQQYSLDGGAWTDCTAGSYTLTGFTPGSTHTIKTRIYRSDSGLETQSSQISITLKSLPTSNTPSNTNFNSNGTSVTSSISSTDYLSGWYIIVKDGNNEIINGSNSQSTATSKSWSCSSANATAMLNRHGSNNSWSLSVEYYVISNGTTYQLTPRTCTCILPNGTYLPTFTSSNLSYEVTNQTSNDITGSNQKVIKGISVVRAKYTAASPQGGASMSSYLATSGTKSGSSNASTLYADINGAVDASSFSVQATDSRGRSTVASKDYTTYIDYFAPYTNSGGVNIARVDGVGANIRISISGKYKYWSGLQNPNTITQVSVQYKLKSSPTYNNITISLSISYDSSNNFTATGTTTGDLFDIGNEYDVQVVLKDVFNNILVNASIPTGTVLMWKDLTNKRVGIGKKPEYTLDVNGNINSNNVISNKFIGDSKQLRVHNGTGATSGVWVKLCRITFSGHNQGEFVNIKILIGEGNNSRGNQNASIDMLMQLGWSGDTSTHGRFGCYAYLNPGTTNFTTSNVVPKIISISNIDYEIWLYTTATYCRPNTIIESSNNVTVSNQYYTQTTEPTGTACDLVYQGYKLDLGTNNTTDTWVPVKNGNTFQHREIPTTYNSTAPTLTGLTVNGDNGSNNIVKAGTIEGQANFDASAYTKQSFMGSTNIGGTWYNLINVRHRNGGGDGTSYGLQIRSILTSAGSELEYRNNYGGLWSDWTKVGYTTGSNTNGFWIKYADGTMECYKKVTGTANITTGWGSGYTTGSGNTIDLGNFPQTFTEEPNIQVTVRRGTGGMNFWLGTVSDSTASYAGKISLLRFNSASNVGYILWVRAVGKWK